jgi:hypothetical protein
MISTVMLSLVGLRAMITRNDWPNHAYGEDGHALWVTTARSPDGRD